MANGYLGKISAIVTANTAQFQRGMGDAARDARAFATTIEGNLRRASSDAQKSIRSILTPIQQLQASLQAAGERGLSFRGFRGAIRDVEDLKQRLAGLQERDVALVLRVSGFQQIGELQQAIREITSRDIRLVGDAGGAQGAEAGIRRIIAARDELASDEGFSALQQRIANVSRRLAELRESGQLQLTMSGGSDTGQIRQIRAEYELFSQSLADLERQRNSLVSTRVGLNIDFSELDQLAQKFTRISPEALGRLMDELGQAQFRDAQQRLVGLTQIANGLSKPLQEAVASFGQLDGRVQAAFIPALSAAQNEVMGLERVLRETGTFGVDAFNRIESQVDSAILSIRQMKELADSIASIKTGNEMAFQQPDVMAAIGRARAFSDKATGAMEAASPQVRTDTVERLRGILALTTQIQEQFAAMRNAQASGLTFIAGDLQVGLERTAREIDAIVEDGKRELRIDVDTTTAQPKVDAIQQSLDRIRELADFTITGNVQSFRQAEQEVARILSVFDKLEDSRKQQLSGQMSQFVGDFTASNGFFDPDGIRKMGDLVDAEAKAQRGAESLRSSLGRLADRINPSAPIDVLESNLYEAIAAVDKLDPKLKAIGKKNLGVVENYLRGLPGEPTDSDINKAARAAAKIRDQANAAIAPKQSSPAQGRNPLGAVLGTSEREIDNLRSKVIGLQGEVEKLPMPLSAKFIPDVIRVRQEFEKLSISSSAAEIERVVKSATQLGDEMRRSSSAASNFGGSVGEAFEESKINRAKGEIAALRNILITIGATTGDAADAVDDLAAGWRRATSEVGGASKNAAQLKQLSDEAAESVQNAVNASGQKIDVRGALASVGDIGRFGADKASLAFQQLGFAIDDFMSSTGGIDQKIRAVSNNISQMAYIVGSTKGLFIALGATMAAQSAVMIMKFVNGGKTAEDQTKALNDALAKQKSLLEDLKQAFDSFANSLGRNMFSKSAAEARDFQRQIEEIVKKQKERRDSRLADLSPGVQKERSEQNRIDRELEGATDMGQRVALLAQKAASKRREEAAAKAAAEAPAPGQEEIGRVIQGTIRANEFLRGGRMTRASEEAAENRRRQAAGDVAAAKTAEEQASVVRQRLAERREMAAKPMGISNFEENPEIMRAREDVAALESLLAQLEEQIRSNGNALAVSVLEGSVKVAKSLEAAQALLDETLIPFSQTRAEADRAAEELTKIVEELKAAKDPARIAELEKQRAALEQQSAAYRAAAETIRTFADTIKQISTVLADQVASEAQSNADRARRDANAAVAAAGVNGEFGPNGERRRAGDAEMDVRRAEKRRDEAQAAARRAEDRAADVRDENERARREFEQNPDAQTIAERKRLKELQAIIDDKTKPEEARANAAREKDDILRGQARRIEDSPAGRQAREKADMADRADARDREKQRQEDERFRAGLRGRDLGLTEGERAAREAEDGLRDIGAARDGGRINGRQAQEQANRFAQEQMRAVAPAIAEMADAVKNAVLQGPSRQALQVNDISTTQGSIELMRLLRGDDAARSANIVELVKQNQKLSELITVMKDVATKMGVVLEL